MNKTARPGSYVILPLGILLTACFLLGGCSQALSSVTSSAGTQENLVSPPGLPVLLEGIPRQAPETPPVEPSRITVEHATIHVPD